MLPLSDMSGGKLKPGHTDSATESENDKPPVLEHTKGKQKAPPVLRSLSPMDAEMPPDAILRRRSPTPKAPGPAKLSDSDSSPVRPKKKAKASSGASSGDDSEEERKKRVASLKSGAPKRGARQPLKRGGKRF